MSVTDEVNVAPAGGQPASSLNGSKTALRAEHLSRSVQGKRIVDDIGLEVGAGEVRHRGDPVDAAHPKPPVVAR